jgi:hypothetical protein
VYPPALRDDIDSAINGKATKNVASKSTFGRRSKTKYLKYCPMCTSEDIRIFGETYWRRQHQLSEIRYCLKHEIRLVDSPVLTIAIGNGVYPASGVVSETTDKNVTDDYAQYKDKLLKIGKECEWLIKHGADINWSDNSHKKYARLLRDRGLATFKGICNQYEKLHNEFFDYWGRDFIDELFTVAEGSNFKGWTNKISQSGMANFTPLHHILLMCYLAGSVKGFIESNPAETPFGHPPYECENPICPHYHKDGAAIIDMVEYHCALAAYFKCTYCGMLYKYTESSHCRGLRMILDYGHLWEKELIHCYQDPKMTRERAMEILKCTRSTLEAQKRKHGLMKPFLHDAEIGAENYYKAEVAALCEKYDEVTIALLDEKVPGAYTYLQRNDYDWIRNKVVFDNERQFRLEREELLLNKLREVIAVFDADGYPDRVLSYGYIANLIGATRDDLRSKMSPNSELRAFLDEIVEHKATWRQERAARMRKTNPGQGRIPRKRPSNTGQKRIHTCTVYAERVTLILSNLQDVIATFETEGYPDRRLSYRFLASLVGVKVSELQYKADVSPELKAYLKEVVEPEGSWREERAAKGKYCSKYEEQIRRAVDKIWTNPPQEQISRNYIAKVAGLSKDILKDSHYLTEITKDFVETRIEWHKRRLIAAYHNLPASGRPYSIGAIYHAASIDYTTYKKHQELFTEIVNNLNYDAEQRGW